jgi:GxxExxY protein
MDAGAVNKASPHSLLPYAVRQGLSAEILEDRACADAIDAAYEVHRALGVAHNKETYLAALALELRHRKRKVHRNATFSVLYRKQVVGSFEADLLLEERILLQIGTDSTLRDIEKSDAIRGLSAGGVKVGLVFHFSGSELSFARIL